MSWYGLHSIVRRLADRVCRHPKGIVCAHRQYEHDQWLKGYGAGNDNGERHIEARWRGSVTGVGPYADYPPPLTPRPPRRVDS